MSQTRFLISIAFIFFLNSGAPVSEAFAQTPPTQGDEVIRVESDLTNLLFIATDKQNHFITTLRQEDVRNNSSLFNARRIARSPSPS